MSFKTAIDIGCFDWKRVSAAFITRPLTAAEVDEALVCCGGRLLPEGHETEPQLTGIAELMVRQGGQDVRGFLGREPVVLHPTGYVRLALDPRSARPVAALVRLLVERFGCTLHVWDCDEQEPARVLAWLDRLAGQHHV